MTTDGLLDDVAGYVLAGGRSTRMGQDKAMLELAGWPLAEHAVRKLRKVTGDVCILSRDPRLAAFAPLVGDNYANCGPLGGIEAALAHTTKRWALIVPVDSPFVPAALLRDWVNSVLRDSKARLSLFSVDGVVQPALCLLHCELADYVRGSLDAGRLKLFPELKDAVRRLAAKRNKSDKDLLLLREWNEKEAVRFLKDLDNLGKGGAITAAQRAALPMWFSNFNTPDEFAAAQRYPGALDV
ncbi:MAG: molybdenum cofactor guanylyltransferase [Acidobacteria bacterium]|nr:molybdenum cofactor guanylyltransferase [Acidobacteriota bacterium]